MKKSEFRFINQRLVSTIFKINREYKEVDKNLDFDTIVDIAKSNTENKAFVTLTLEILKEDELKTNPYYIKLEIEGVFEWNDELENIDNYLSVNAPSVLFSYLRSILIQLTVMSGFPPLNLPFVNFSKEK